jgi:hypothetical protein
VQRTATSSPLYQFSVPQIKSTFGIAGRIALVWLRWTKVSNAS